MKLKKSKFSLYKARAIESFIRFSQGLNLPQYPLTMHLEVSNLCDLQCVMCPTFSAINAERIGSIKSKKRELFDAGNISKLQPFLESALHVHAFGDGEPTIHPNFLEILDTLKSYEVMTDFFTNGMHLTEKNCFAMVDSRVSAITISFSGSTKEEYESVYVNGNFEVVLDGIRRLAAYKRQSGSLYPRIDINSVGFRHHIKELPKFVRLMGEAGANLIHVKPLDVPKSVPFLEPFVAAYRPSIEGKKIEEATIIAKELGVALGVEVFKRNLVADDASVDDFAKSRRAPNSEEIRSKYADFSAVSIHEFKELSYRLKSNGITVEKNNQPDETIYINDAKGKSHSLKMRQIQLNSPCLEPFKNIYIAVNGDVKPCCFSKEDGLGNVFDDGFGIWGNEPFTQFRNGVLKGQYPSICNECIRLNNAPAKHNINAVVVQYSKWLQHTYGISLPDDLLVRAKKLPDNREIIENWQNKI